MARLTTLTITLRASNRTRVTYPVNQEAAEREAREILRTGRGDTKIRTTRTPQTVTLVHKETRDKAVITCEDL